MNAQQALHPTDQSLHAYGLGKLDDASAESVNRHLESCPDCRSRVAEMSPDSFLGKLRDAQGRPQSTGPVVSSLAGMSMMDGGASPSAPPPANTLPPGLADHPDYRILRELGRGGMGVVYLAENTLMGRKEVLKVVGSHLISRPGVLDRFLREIRSVAKLHHNNIVAAYSALRFGESLVLTMEYVEGLDLASFVKAKGPLPVAHACNFIYQAALGLQHAHDRGMVHRDIKPANLMLSREGKKPIVKVLDFGLAKVTIEGQADNALTREGQMLGTPDYIAPEQIRDAQTADIRADIYSLGCTFYYLLTGEPPFGGDNLWDLYQAHFSLDAGPLNLARPEIPAELAALVAKMMAKEPAKRFQTPGEIAQSLLPFFKSEAVGSVGSKPEISRIGQPEARPGRASAPTQATAEMAPAPVSPAKKSMAPIQPGSIFEGLIDFREEDPLFDMILDRTPASRQQGPRTWTKAVGKIERLGPRTWWTAGVLLFGLVIACGVWVLKIKTAHGVIVLENLPENAVVEVDGDKVTVTSIGGEPVQIEATAGKHGVVVKRGNDFPFVKSVTVESGKPYKLTVQLESPATRDPSKSSPSATRINADDAVKAPSSQEPIKNSIGMTLKLIPPGEFMMGSTVGDADEHPRHRVRITRPFYLGVYEVTQKQYRDVMGSTPSRFSSNGDGKARVSGELIDNYPVESVSWLDAVEFCNRLSEKEGLKPFYEIEAETARVPDWAGPGYRLPTEAEWEYACRANSRTQYSFGNTPAGLGEHGWYAGNSDGQTHPVGQKRPNAFGLFDMHGNVWEWCWDGYGERYYQESPVDDPTGPGHTAYRVFRGGSWDFEPPLVRAAIRRGNVPGYRNSYLGFRAARVQSGR